MMLVNFAKIEGEEMILLFHLLVLPQDFSVCTGILPSSHSALVTQDHDVLQSSEMDGAAGATFI